LSGYPALRPRPVYTIGMSVSKTDSPPVADPSLLCEYILAIAERGDQRAFAALFSHFAPRVKSYLLRQGATAAAAEDIAQETMLSVWRKAAYFDPAKAGA